MSKEKLKPVFNIPKSIMEPSGSIVIVWDLNNPLITVFSGIIDLHKLFNKVPRRHPEKVVNKINLIDLYLVAKLIMIPQLIEIFYIRP